ncbi:hypothetical protein F4604DRAFT_1677626 [Suillus subluteus]|nr:hypothetical protein F4604DRAFT_1677626 [Suillus subluteus]
MLFEVEASRGHRCYPLPQSANQGLFLIKNERGFIGFENIVGLDGIVQIPLPLHPALMDYATHLHILLPLTFLINTAAKRDAVDRNPKRKLWAKAAINILNTARENIEHKLHLESAISLWMLAGENYFCTLLLTQMLAVCETLGVGMGVKQKDVDGGKGKGKVTLGWLVWQLCTGLFVTYACALCRGFGGHEHDNCKQQGKTRTSVVWTTYSTSAKQNFNCIVGDTQGTRRVRQIELV